MQIDFDARLAASTVLVDGREWCQGTLTNLALNPSFEAAGSTVEVARNRIPNPRAVSTGSSVPWATVNGTATWETGSGLGGGLPDTFRRLVASASTAGWYGAVTGLVAAGETVTLRRLVRASRACTVRLGLEGPGMSTPMYSPYIPVPAGEWTWVTYTLTMPTLISGQPVVLMCYAYSLQIGDVLDQTAASIDQHTTYLDGSFSPDPDLAPTWTGTVNNSAAVLSGIRPAQVTDGAGRAAIQSQDGIVSGAKSLRVLRTTTAESATVGAVVHTWGAGDVGKTFTVAAWCTIPDGYDATTDATFSNSRSRAIYVWAYPWMSQQAPSTPGRHLVSAIVTVPVATTLRLGGGGAIGQSVHWDDFTIVEGEHPDLMPFHGSTVNPEWPGVTYAWTGSPNASTSTRTTPEIDRIEVDRDPGTGWVPVRGGRRDVINGFVALTDHEMPLHQEVRYRVAGYSGNTYVGAFTGTVDTSIPGWCGVFVKIPANPNATVMVDPTNSIDIDSSTQGGSYDIAAGSSIAVAAWSGVNASRFTLNAITKTDGDSAQMRALLQKNRVILLQGPDWEPFPPGWYYVESVSEGLRGDGAIKQGRKWSLSLVSTGVPSGDTAGVAGASWNQIRAKYATWDELKTANSTWFDVLQGGN